MNESVNLAVGQNWQDGGKPLRGSPSCDSAAAVFYIYAAASLVVAPHLISFT